MSTLPYNGRALPGKIRPVPMAAATTIHGGTAVVLNTSGYAESATSATGKTTVGRAKETVTNAGSAGDATVEVEIGVFEWDNATSTDAITIADVGKLCYWTDDHTVSDVSTSRSVAGRIWSVDEAGTIFVDSRILA